MLKGCELLNQHTTWFSLMSETFRHADDDEEGRFRNVGKTTSWFSLRTVAATVLLYVLDEAQAFPASAQFKTRTWKILP